jgi:hypothetical protein
MVCGRANAGLPRALLVIVQAAMSIAIPPAIAATFAHHAHSRLSAPKTSTRKISVRRGAALVKMSRVAL